MARFVQVIEWRTERIEDVRALSEDWRRRAPSTGPDRLTVCADRDNEGAYMTIAEFPSYEAAMANSDHPETKAFAERMAALCDGPPVFHNLDVVETDVRTDQPSPAAAGSATNV